jgi:hypothetical protein
MKEGMNKCIVHPMIRVLGSSQRPYEWCAITKKKRVKKNNILCMRNSKENHKS